MSFVYVLGALRSALSAPVGIVLDDYENCLTCYTYLSTTVSSRKRNNSSAG